MDHSRLQRLMSRVVVPGVFLLVFIVFVAWAATAGTTAGGQPTIDPYRYATPDPTPAPVAATPEFQAAVQGALPDPDTVWNALHSVDAADVGDTTMTVVDPVTGQVLVDDGSNTLVTPASNWKLLVGAAVLRVYGADHRFTTKVVSTNTGIILVGGGDPFLAGYTAGDYPERASLQQLADLVAAALGPGNVELGYDESYFAGTGWNDGWEDGDLGWVTPTTALWADGGIVNGGHSETAALAAAELFSDLLEVRGVHVTNVVSARAAETAPEVAAVQSPPLGVIVQETLRLSDNSAAEVLFRHVGRAEGGTGSIADARARLPQVLRDIGLWADGMVVRDGSGLSYGDQATPYVIAQAIALGFEDAGYRWLLVGLPTAGGDGTLGLSTRYDDAEEQIARGKVRAKTGTLTGVHTLGGFVQTSSGALLAFAFTCNNAGDDLAAQDWLDHVTAKLAEL
jgi:D-alanyl-D-alanine carboxypeptidase/D-alanyl-D-alanine-endopeptidase (penicillin-binding protein 4)